MLISRSTNHPRLIDSWKSAIVAPLFLLVASCAMTEDVSVAGVHNRLALTRETKRSECQLSDIHPEHGVWRVTTRHLPNLLGEACCRPDLRVTRLRGGQFHESQMQSLLENGEDGRLTIVYVHGNRMDADWAVRRAMTLYRHVVSRVDRPLRFVIWSWPSDRISGQVRDVRSKGVRTNSEAFFLGRVLADLERQGPLSLLGFSYGCRIITGSLHLMGGGQLAGRRLPYPPDASRTAQVALLAGAVHNNWLESNRPHGQAVGKMRRLMIMFNSRDPVLRRYRFIEKDSNPTALGYGGLSCPTCLPAGCVRQHNVATFIGSSHAERTYYQSVDISLALIGYLAWNAEQSSDSSKQVDPNLNTPGLQQAAADRRR